MPSDRGGRLLGMSCSRVTLMQIDRELMAKRFVIAGSSFKQLLLNVAHDAGLAAAMEPGKPRQPAEPVERNPATRRDDRLPECFSPDGLRRARGDAIRGLHAPSTVRHGTCRCGMRPDVFGIALRNFLCDDVEDAE